MDLIIVESPTKARTLTRFLKGTFAVEATMGHIRDLPKGELGVDLDHEFAPSYVIPRDKAKRVKELVDAAAKADNVILATDPDREGEAIAWHVAQILEKAESRKQKTESGKRKAKKAKNLPSAVGLLPSVSQYQRIVFHEITESAIKDALETSADHRYAVG